MRSRKLLLPTLSLLAVAAAAPAEIVERVVAKVNGDIVTLSEFQARQVAAVQAAGITTEDQVEKFLRDNNARILQEVVVKTQSGSLALANDLVRRSRAGEDFAELARAYSAAPTRAAGGDLGRLSKGDLTPDIEKAALALPVGGVSAPLPTADGFRILKVVEKTEGTQVPFEEVKAEIQKRISA